VPPPQQYVPPPDDGFGRPTYHHTPAENADRPRDGAARTGPASGSVARAAARQTGRAARAVTRKVISASKADGAHESGLTALIWNQVLSYGTDAMITVALAGTVFFGASTSAQRGNVLLYLLITMAPFAVVAPVIGPVLDRFQHGRRWTMAATAAGRAVLALVMAAHPAELLILYPCALGSLVLSKAYGVLRASAAPRLVPRGMTLTEANARLSTFGLGSTLVLGGFVGILIKISGSYSFGLIVTAIGFVACAVFAVRLPHQVDSAVAAPRSSREAPRPAVQQPTTAWEPAREQGRPGRWDRLAAWSRRGFDDHIVTALQGESALRLLSGLLTIYLAFYVESTAHGLKAAVELGAVVAAAGAGNGLGNLVGTKLKLNRPELVIITSTIVAAAACLLVAIAFDIAFAVVGMLIAAITNALSKIALDALVQRDVAESLRSSAFARSETFLQLAWVLGAAIGVGLPSDRHHGGALGFWVAGAILAGAAVLVTLRHGTVSRPGSARPHGTVNRATPGDAPDGPSARPGSVNPL
jgi:MFS family permease